METNFNPNPDNASTATLSQLLRWGIEIFKTPKAIARTIAATPVSFSRSFGIFLVLNLIMVAIWYLDSLLAWQIGDPYITYNGTPTTPSLALTEAIVTTIGSVGIVFVLFEIFKRIGSQAPTLAQYIQFINVIWITSNIIFVVTFLLHVPSLIIAGAVGLAMLVVAVLLFIASMRGEVVMFGLPFWKVVLVNIVVLIVEILIIETVVDYLV